MNFFNVLIAAEDYTTFALMDIHCTDKERFILKKIARSAQTLGVPCYLIGGFVRDKLLHRKTKDIDIVCVGDGVALAHIVAEQFTPTPTVAFFKNFGTAQIKVDLIPTPATKDKGTTSSVFEAVGEVFDIEIVGARKESYHHNSRKPAVETGSLEDDQLRRDFTINALAISLNQDNYGQLIDPFNGMADLQRKIIRTPLDPLQTFSDDPLRMMRAIRFSTQLHFTIDTTTLEGICKTAERIKIVSQERITDELNKIILTTKPSIGFDLLYKSGLLKYIFPAMVDLAGAEYVDGIGHKDNFYHTLQVLDNVAHHSNNLWLRWAAILHDIAKPATKKFEEGHGWTFHGHEVFGARMVPRIFKQLKLPQNDMMRFVQKMVFLHLRPISLTKKNITDSAIRRLLFDAGDHLESLMILCRADITSKNKTKVNRYLENYNFVENRLVEVEEQDKMRNWQPPITGEMIMQTFQLPPSKIVGDIKDAIREAILDNAIPNTYEAAYTFMLEKAAKMNISPVK